MKRRGAMAAVVIVLCVASCVVVNTEGASGPTMHSCGWYKSECKNCLSILGNQGRPKDRADCPACVEEDYACRAPPGGLKAFGKEGEEKPTTESVSGEAAEKTQGEAGSTSGTEEAAAVSDAETKEGEQP